MRSLIARSVASLICGQSRPRKNWRITFNFESLERTLRRCGFDPRSGGHVSHEWFLLQGIDYIGRDDIGRKCHGQRMALERNLEVAGLTEVRRGFSRWLSSQGIGRETVVYAVKSS